LSAFSKWTSISGRSLRQSKGRVLVEVGLHRAAALDRNLVTHQLTQPFDQSRLHIVQRAARIDDPASNIAC
jgi:hypothetical protein